MSDSLGPVKHSSPVQAPLQFSREMFQQPAVPPPPFNQRYIHSPLPSTRGIYTPPSLQPEVYTLPPPFNQ